MLIRKLFTERPDTRKWSLYRESRMCVQPAALADNTRGVVIYYDGKPIILSESGARALADDLHDALELEEPS